MPLLHEGRLDVSAARRFEGDPEPRASQASGKRRRRLASIIHASSLRQRLAALNVG